MAIAMKGFNVRRYTIEEIEKARANNSAWYDVECAPTGTIESLDDVRFAIDYGKEHYIDVKNIEKYVNDDNVIGCELSLGSHFGGASFYYYLPMKG